MTYTPDIRRYQQLVYGGATAGVDCTAWGGALCTDAHTQGAIKLTGRQIRLASSEPVPDHASPGLNVGQVDAAIYKLTGGKVNLDTLDPREVGRQTVRGRVIGGRWVNLAVKRGVLVDRGYGGSNGFRGAHDITVHCNPGDDTPVIGDPLVPYYIRSTWDAVLDAAQAVTASGYIFCSFTRDLIPEYHCPIKPDPGEGLERFYTYTVKNGVITGRKPDATKGFDARCTAPRYYPGVHARRLVRLLGGAREGKYVDARRAREV